MAVHEQHTFGGGLNAGRAADKLAENEVAAAVNIDFGLEEGAAVVRRGTERWFRPTTQPIRRIFRNYNLPYNYGASPFYFATADGIYRYRDGQTTKIVDGGAEHPAFGTWKEWTLIANGSSYWMDNGETTREWIGQAPAAAPSVQVQTAAPLSLSYGGWVVVHGTEVEQSNGMVVVNSVDRQVVVDVAVLPQFGDLSNNAGVPIGDYGIHYLDLMISDPGIITLITQDYSIDSADFSGGTWHAELRPGDTASTLDWGEAVVESLPEESAEERERAIEELRRNLRAPRNMFPTSPNLWHVWAVARPQFELVSRGSTPGGWSSIGRVRVVIQGTDEFTVRLRNFTIAGTEGYPLNDAVVGYTWWETWATVDEDGVVIRESAPSPPSAPVRMQAARAVVQLSTSPVGNAHGYTHRILYRQGGLMRDAHRVAIVPLSTTTVTDAVGDVEAVFEPTLERDVHSRDTMPGNIVAISEPFMGRIFVAHTNIVMWSEPNRPDVFRKDSWVQVSHRGDEVQALVVWGSSLFIINRDSVYELTGTDFSADGDWRLYRTPSRYGSLSRAGVTRTPFGITLYTADGIVFYAPGGSGEVRLPWIESKVGLAWSRSVTTDRLAQHQPGAAGEVWAVWTTTRLYVAIQPANTVYVLDFAHETAFYYTYPFVTTCGFYDVEGRLLVGTTGGSIMFLEAGSQTDTNDAGQAVAIQAYVQTRTWSWPAAARLMNISLDYRGSVTLRAYEASNPSTTVINTTLPAVAARTRSTPSMQGAGGDAVWFSLNLHAPAAVYSIDWDRYDEPLLTVYHRTQYYTPDTEMHYQLARLTIDTSGGSVGVQLFVDGTQVLETTVTTPGDSPVTVPVTVDAKGWTAYAILSSTTPFRFYSLEWDGTPEPPRVTHLLTEPFDFGGEVEVKTVETVLDCLGGTVTAKLYLDAQEVATYTFTGNGVKGYAVAAPLLPYDGAFNHPFARVARVEYSSTTPFKHYKTWYGVVKEPSRVRHWRSETQWWTDDQEVQAVEWAAEGFGQLLTFKVFVDSQLVHTFQRTASGHVGGTEALPSTVVGRSAHVIITSAGPFKPYGVVWRTRALPPRVTRWRSEDKRWASPTRIRTVVASVDPMGGTVTATVYVNGVAVRTVNLSGPSLSTFQIGLDLDVAEGTAAFVVYNSATPFRHFETEWHDEPQPFEKENWGYSFNRPLGTAQMLRALRWNMWVRATGPTVLNLKWYEAGDPSTPIHEVDVNVSEGHNVRLWGLFPPTARCTVLALDVRSHGVPIRVYNVDVDVEVTGLKGSYRTTIRGVPNAG